MNMYEQKFTQDELLVKLDEMIHSDRLDNRFTICRMFYAAKEQEEYRQKINKIEESFTDRKREIIRKTTLIDDRSAIIETEEKNSGEVRYWIYYDKLQHYITHTFDQALVTFLGIKNGDVDAIVYACKVLNIKIESV
jgi:type IV secretory pathway component VirB8